MLPWGNRDRPRSFIPRLEERAITVRQLRELRLWLQRLCKARQLVCTEGSPNHAVNELIDWYDINLYDVCNEVIKKVIPFVDPKFKGAGGSPEPVSGMRGRSSSFCSWVEFIARGPARPDFMVSHSWAGRFRDFTAVVDTIVSDKVLSVNTSFWVCTFANNQWGEDFGMRILECPFVKAVSAARTTILIVDRDASSLGRIWCGLEIFSTIRRQKDLEVYTPSGRMGGKSGRASSGPLVDAVRRWDIRKGEASGDAYRRQILTYIAYSNDSDADETEGLETQDGTLKLTEDCRPMLKEGVEARDEQVVRANGAHEYAYEAGLFKRRADRFEDLNMEVRCEVLASIGKVRKPVGCSIKDRSQRAVTLGNWRSLLRESHSLYWQWRPVDPSTGKPVHQPWGSMTFKDLNQTYIRNLIDERRGDREMCSYMELVADGPRYPQYFVCLSQRMKLKSLMRGLDWFAEALRLPDSTPLFIDRLAKQVPYGYRRTNAGARPCVDEGVDAFRERVEAPIMECQGLLVLLDDDLGAMQHGYRLMEIELAIRNGIDIFIACETGAMACTRSFPTEGWMFGTFQPEIARLLRSIKSEQSMCANYGEQGMINQFFEQEGGKHIYEKMDNRLARWGAGHLLRSAARENSPGEICSLCETPGILLNSDTLRGGQGETALHVAAASGSVAAMKVLLEHTADPNVEDDLREQPLHYAALSGQAEAAVVLLQARADPHGESSLAQTPLQVAQDNPAGFLDVSTGPLVQLLQRAQNPKHIIHMVPKAALARPLLELMEAQPAEKAVFQSAFEAAVADLGISEHELDCHSFLDWLYRPHPSSAPALAAP